VKEYLRVDEQGKPHIQFFSSCGSIVRNLPMLQHDIKKVNDVAIQPHDITHSPDALRYWCSRRQLVPEANTKPDAHPFLNKTHRKEDGVGEEYLIGGFGG